MNKRYAALGKVCLNLRKSSVACWTFKGYYLLSNETFDILFCNMPRLHALSNEGSDVLIEVLLGAIGYGTFFNARRYTEEGGDSFHGHSLRGISCRDKSIRDASFFIFKGDVCL